MGISHFIFQLLIQPLELLFEVVYGYAMMYGHNCGLSIFFLSLVMNLLLLPLYRRADAIQDEERAIEKALEPGIAHIRKTFTGDERFMMQQAYYRRNNYKPYYSLKGSLPLLLEIPFFIAAYHFLSHLDQLRGASLGPIADLSAPDALLTVGGVSISLLPILMTLINFASSAIYTRGLPKKDKLQLYGMALVFLILLYSSPSGLVLYWTLNNLFSLIKNLFTKLKRPGVVLRFLLSALGLVLLIYALGFTRGATFRHRLVLVLAASLMELPLLMERFRPRLSRCVPIFPETGSAPYFFSSALLLTLLTGALIPSAVVASSPEEFFHVVNYYSPLLHIVNGTLFAAGLFMVWFGLFYFLASPKGKWIFSLLLWLFSAAAIVDYMFFGTHLGKLSSQLIYDNPPVFSLREQLLNLAVLAVLLAVLLLVWHRGKSLVRGAAVVLCVAILGMTGYNAFQIARAVPEIRALVETAPEEKPHFRLSRNGKNVVVLMMDRAIGAYVPYLFQEKPELAAQFEGFTYYPNTVSFGPCTNIGTPALYGGYEYVPEEMNKRDSELLADKHNEALLVMPRLFSGAGYETTVIDPSYAGYVGSSDLSIYDPYPGIHAYHAEGQMLYEGNVFTEKVDHIWSRNFFCFGLMKSMPLCLQPYLYQNGLYFESSESELGEDISYSRKTYYGFLMAYSVLRGLPEITETTDTPINTYLFLANQTSHETALLQEPDYEPAVTVDNRVFDREHWDRFIWNGQPLRIEDQRQMSFYHCNMAALMQLGRWFDTLRENGVYDNTRIIIVSDHGADTHSLESMLLKDEKELDALIFNALLMVKDFDSHTFSTDERLMTNADTPWLSAEGLLDPVNPFTGVPFSTAPKQTGELHVFNTDAWNIATNNGTTFLPGTWYAVHDDIRDSANWRLLGDY